MISPYFLKWLVRWSLQGFEKKGISARALIAAALSTTTKKQLSDAYIQSLHTNKEGHARKQALLTYDLGQSILQSISRTTTKN
jgi:hypothetical protein